MKEYRKSINDNYQVLESKKVETTLLETYSFLI
jgi:hypothetical protein